MIKKGIEIKLNVQPIYIGLVHKYFFETMSYGTDRATDTGI